MKEEEESTSLSLSNETRLVEEEFIKSYEQLPQLWDATHPDYSNKYKRNEAYDILLVLFRRLNRTATRYHVRVKINILRSCYRKELRKYVASKSIGPDGEEIFTHKPTSWKFYALRFLGGDEDVIKKTSRIGDEHVVRKRRSLAEVNIEEENDSDDENNQESDYSETGNCEVESSHIEIPSYSPPKRKIKRVKVEANNDNDYYEIRSDNDVLEREYEAIGANVACKLKRMNLQQRCHAELLINKVLIKGLKNNLSEETDLTDVWDVK